MRLLPLFLRRFVTIGTLTVIDAAGRRHVFGMMPEPRVTIRLHDRAIQRTLLRSPELGLGEGYMEGRVTLEEGTLRDLLALAIANQHRLEQIPGYRAVARLERLFRALQQYNPVGRARRHVAHHYDLSGELYRLFLDTDRQYSCAYYASPEVGLDQAQADKKRHIAAKLCLEPGHRVLDIGCGWGGLALDLARWADVSVLGVTLSTEQLAVARRRAERAGLSQRVRFELLDYRLIDDSFDRIVSVGMFEHVGYRYYDAFFRAIRRLLAPRGLALIHSIGRMSRPTYTSPWVRKYIFPGGYVPSLSEVFRATEAVRLWVTDVEILRLHYARTLRDWQRRFAANRDRVAEIYDERFCRMWEFYLAGAEASFRQGTNMVFQMQLAKDRTAVPLTRDYMVDTEREMGASAAAAA